jgi:hypothetical protein
VYILFFKNNQDPGPKKGKSQIGKGNTKFDSEVEGTLS